MFTNDMNILPWLTFSQIECTEMYMDVITLYMLHNNTLNILNIFFLKSGTEL